MENGIRITTRNREGRYYKRIGETPPTNGGYGWDQSCKKTVSLKEKHGAMRMRRHAFVRFCLRCVITTGRDASARATSVGARTAAKR